MQGFEQGRVGREERAGEGVQFEGGRYKGKGSREGKWKENGKKESVKEKADSAVNGRRNLEGETRLENEI